MTLVITGDPVDGDRSYEWEDNNLPRPGYVICACRDCFVETIADDISLPTLCYECDQCGCNGHTECHSPQAYGGMPECEP